MASKEEKLTAPLLPAVQPAPLLPAVQPAPLSAAVQPAAQLAAVGGRAVGVVWLGGDRCSLVLSALLARRVGAHSVALVLYYFNTDQCAMYCVLYVFLFIKYNTVFFITQPWFLPALCVALEI